MGQQIVLPPAYQRPSGGLWRSGDQLNLVDGTPTLVLLNTVLSSFSDGIENVGTNRITPGVPGYYSILAQVNYKDTTVVADKTYTAEIWINGVMNRTKWSHSSSAGSLSVTCYKASTLIALATDYIQLYATSNAGVDTVDIYGNPGTLLEVQRVR